MTALSALPRGQRSVLVLRYLEDLTEVQTAEALGIRPGTVKSIGRDGKETVTEADGLLATCLQHEIDHLNGVLFIDHISKLKRDMVVRKFKKLAREKAPQRLVG